MGQRPSRCVGDEQRRVVQAKLHLLILKYQFNFGNQVIENG